MNSTNTMQALREIATNLQVGDVRRAHAQMEIVAIFAGVDTSSVYAVAEEMAEEAHRRDCTARNMSWDSTALVGRLTSLNNIVRAA